MPDSPAAWRQRRTARGTESPNAASLRERVEWRVAVALEPFLVIDVTPEGESYSTVFHILRDMVDEGRLAHGGQGYSRV